MHKYNKNKGNYNNNSSNKKCQNNNYNKNNFSNYNTEMEVESPSATLEDNTQQNENPQTKNLSNTINSSSNNEKNITKIVLFPGENYEFDEKLLHYNIFGFNKENLVAKKCAILTIDKQTKKPIAADCSSASEEAVRSIGKYYTPRVDDFVIGTITQKNPEFYKVDIGSYTHAVLNTKDFEGASKKTKPNLGLGDLVFARVLKVNKFDAPILSCVSQYDVKNWASGESFFGQLKNGNVFGFAIQHACSFINSDNYLLNRLNDMLSFEIVVGHNGRLWINSDCHSNILDIYRLLIKSISLDKSEVEIMVHDTFIDKIKQ